MAAPRSLLHSSSSSSASTPRHSSSSLTSSSKWDASIPPLLRPAVRAYLLGYASAVAPRILTLLLQHISRHRRRWRRQQQSERAKDSVAVTPPTPLPGRESGGGEGSGAASSAGDGPSAAADEARRRLVAQQSFAAQLEHILRNGLDPHRFPTFCAVIVGGSTILELPLRSALDKWAKSLSDVARRRLSRWLAAFVAGWLSLRLLQAKEGAGFVESVPVKSAAPPGVELRTTRYAGRTLDLSLFAATRALDVVVGELWSRRRARRVAKGTWTKAEGAISALTDPFIFVTSSALIMWAWFYTPAQLPASYNRWISSAAAVDPRLIEALRRCRRRDLVYGRAGDGQAALLGDMCADYGWPAAWGDPAASAPFRCEMVHMRRGVGRGAGRLACERHALRRFAGSWRWAMATYLPLTLTAAAIRLLAGGGKAAVGVADGMTKRQRRWRGVGKALLAAVVSAARSSAFLAAFIALFYYGVCLGRTRVGPRLLLLIQRARAQLQGRRLPSSKPSDAEPVTDNAFASASASAAATHLANSQLLDSGACVASGCALCGWSVLAEVPGRRKDLSLFVAPRALATLLPRRYAAHLQWRETAVFAASAAVVFTCVRENRRRVRGVLGEILGVVLMP